MLHLSQRAMGSESSNIPVSTDSRTQRRDHVLARITDIRRERVRGGGEKEAGPKRSRSLPRHFPERALATYLGGEGIEKQQTARCQTTQNGLGMRRTSSVKRAQVKDERELRRRVSRETHLQRFQGFRRFGCEGFSEGWQNYRENEPHGANYQAPHDDWLLVHGVREPPAEP